MPDSMVLTTGDIGLYRRLERQAERQGSRAYVRLYGKKWRVVRTEFLTTSTGASGTVVFQETEEL